MSCVRLMKKLDIFGEPIQFCLKMQAFQTSAYGGFLTFLFLSTFLSIAFPGFLDLFLKNNINADSSDIYNLSPPPINLTHNNIKFAFSFSDPTLNNESFFHIDLIQGNYERLNGSLNKIKKTRNFQRCAPDYFGGDFKDALNSITSNISNFFCPDPKEDYFVQGKYTNSKFDFINIKVSKCQNTSEVTCASDKEIDTIFKKNEYKVYLNFYFSNHIIDVNNIHNYITNFLDDRIYILMDLAYYKEKNFYFTSNVVATDTSLYSNNNIDDEITTYTFENIFDETSVIIDPLDTKPRYVNLFFRSNFLSKYNLRKVEKLQDYLGYIGGFWSALYLIFSRIGRKHNRNKFMLKVAKNLYYFPEMNSKSTVLEFKESLQKKSNLENMKSRRRGVAPLKTKLNLKNFSFRNRIEEYINKTKNFNIFQKAKNFFSQILSPNNFYKKYKFQKSVKNKALTTTTKDIDLLYLLGKIKEIDKLKQILLDNNQKNLFEYIPKSRITLENDNHSKMNRTSVLFMLRNKNARSLSNDIVKSSKGNKSPYDLHDFYKLYSSYKNMLEEKDLKTKEVNEKIISTLDPELLHIFKMENEKQSERNSEKLSTKDQLFQFPKFDSKN